MPEATTPTPDRRLTVYWVATSLTALQLLLGGTADILRSPGLIEGVNRLGYPAYFIALIGVWKVLGGFALLVPRFARLKEWAYAGIFFDLTGAIVSHVVTHEFPLMLAAAVVCLVLLIVSYVTRPKGRRL